MSNYNKFRDACFEQNTIDELNVALTEEADETDMREWCLTPDEWREAIVEAIKMLKEDEEE